MYSVEYDTNTDSTYGYGDNYVGNYKKNEHPDFIEFTIDEVTHAGHDAGTAGTHWYLSIEKDLGNGRTKEYYGVHLHVSDWLRMSRREIDRARQGLEPTRYVAQRARTIYWVNPTLCNPVIDSSQYMASTEKNQNKMVA